MSRGSGRGRYSIDPDKVNENVEDQRRARDIFRYLNIPEEFPTLKIEKPGVVFMDILPYIVSDPHHMDRNEDYGIAVEDTPWMKKPFFLLRGIGGNNRNFISPRTIGQPCPVQEYQGELRKQRVDGKVIAKLNASLRNLYCVIPRGYERYDEVPHILDISQHAFQDQINKEISERSKYRVFSDPDKGFTLRVRFEEIKVGRGSYYQKANRIDFEERDKEITDAELESVPDLDKMVEPAEYNALKAAFEEVEFDTTQKPDEDDRDRDRDRDRNRGGDPDDPLDDRNRDRGRDRNRGGDPDDPLDDKDRDRDRDRHRRDRT